MAQKPQKFVPGEKILRIDRKEIQFAIENRNHKRQLSQSMETQSTPAGPEDTNQTPGLTDLGMPHAPSTDFSANDSSIFNLSDISLSTFRQTPSGQQPSGPVINQELKHNKGNIFLDQGCNLEEVEGGPSPGSSPQKDYLSTQKRTALSLKKKGVHTVKDLESSSNELSNSLIYDPANHLQEEQMIQKLKRHSQNLSPSKQDALDLSLGNFTDQPIALGDKEQLEESKREDKEELSIYNPERRLIETPLQIREEQRVLRLEQQKLKKEQQRSTKFEVEMAKEMNQLRTRLREVMRENEELRDNVRYLKDERNKDEECEDEKRKPSISKEERDECKSSMIDLRSNIAKIAEQLDQQANFLLQNK